MQVEGAWWLMNVSAYLRMTRIVTTALEWVCSLVVHYLQIVSRCCVNRLPLTYHHLTPGQKKRFLPKKWHWHCLSIVLRLTQECVYFFQILSQLSHQWNFQTSEAVMILWNKFVNCWFIWGTQKCSAPLEWPHPEGSSFMVLLAVARPC